jgi:hypothetical protein
LVRSRHGCLHRAGEKGGAKTGPTPTNRGKPGTKRHLATDRQGIPLAELTTAANVNETTMLEGLFLSPSTVRNHITRIFAKLGVRNRAETIVRARRAGFGHASGSPTRELGP